LAEIILCVATQDITAYWRRAGWYSRISYTRKSSQCICP